jgi:hypothetical protein
METEHHFCGDAEATLAYFVTLDCINFGSGYFADLILEPGKNGYFTIASRLKAESIRVGGFTVDWLQQVNLAECCRIFGQSRENVQASELMRLFAEALNAMGELLADRYSGSFIRFIEQANASAACLAEQLLVMPFYRDIFTIGGQEVFLLKRAQITASDLYIAFSGQGYGCFEDIAELTIFADNLVPHVLQTDGVLNYSPELSKKIMTDNLLLSGSQAEVEIRACSVHAVELLRQVLADAGCNVTSQGLDYLLWNRGQESRYRNLPSHRTRCVYY